MKREPSVNDLSPALVRHSIENLLYEYASLADQLDAQGISGLLVEATLRPPAGIEVSGGVEIEKYLIQLFANAQKSRHMISNVRVYLSEDGLSASSICLYNKWVIGEVPVLDSCGIYHSTFTHVSGEWHYKQHFIESQFRAERK